MDKQIFDVNKSTIKRQYFGSTADLVKNFKSAISACNVSNGLLILQRVSDQCYLFYEQKELQQAIYHFNKNLYLLLVHINLQKHPYDMLLFLPFLKSIDLNSK